MKPNSKRFLLLFVFFVFYTLFFPVSGQLNEIEYVSILEDGKTLAKGDNSYPSVTRDGKYVVFHSDAVQFGAQPGRTQIFIKNMETGKVSLLSFCPETKEMGNNRSNSPYITADGRFVVFPSLGTNLLGVDANGISKDTNNTQDVFLVDRANPLTGLVDDDESNNTLIRVSVNLLGNEIKATSGGTGASSAVPNAVSEDGRFAVFQSHADGATMSGGGNTITDTNRNADIYLWDRATGKSTLISHTPGNLNQTGNGASNWASISNDGKTIVYQSLATDLTPVADGDITSDIILYDVPTQTAKRISVTNSGAEDSQPNEEPKITPSGKFVTFLSAGQLDSNDTNTIRDSYLYDVQRGSLQLIPSFRYGSDARQYQDATLMNSNATVSDDGRFVIFAASSLNLVPGETDLNIGDVYAHDFQTGKNIRLTVARNGEEGSSGNRYNVYTGISEDGKYAVFSSTVGGLVPTVADPAADTDVFYVILDWTPPTVTAHSLQPAYPEKGPKSMTVTFSEPMTKTDSPYPFSVQKKTGADQIANYMIVEAGADGVVDYARCGDPFDPTKDTLIVTDEVTYDNATYTTTVSFNGTVELGGGKYRFLACGNSPHAYAGPALHDGVGNKMEDFVFDFTVGLKPTPNPTVAPPLPDTGFPIND